MERKIWKNLPVELIRRIIYESEPSIDVQLFFKIHPKKLDEAKTWRLWYLLKSHDGIIYNIDTKTLHNFRITGNHIIRRPIELNYYTAGMYVFNETGGDYILETTAPSGAFEGVPCADPWVTGLRVLLKGSGIVRALNVNDAMLNSS